MTEWNVFEVIVYIVGFLVVVIKISNVIQKNTDAINNLTSELSELTDNNKKDHKHFHESINTLKEDVKVMKQKHTDDIELIKTKYNLRKGDK